jgi:urease accessory protein
VPPRPQTVILPLLLAAQGLGAGPALAHHPMGGQLPQTLWQGLLSGLGHPVIGLDHLAFVVGIGLAAAFARHRWLAPLAYVAATLGGCLLFVAGVALPQVELVVALSVLLVGVLVLTARALPTAGALSLFALAGLFHGSAFAASIVGAETTPLVAYLAGFATIQLAIALLVMLAVRGLLRASLPSAVPARLAGALVAGIGFTYLFERIEGLLLA